MKTDEIRSRFLDFFKARGHAIVRSDSLVPQNDPTLLFTGAGMNQFKDYFLGLKKDLRRAASSQKCLRTGDLDEVGRTAYHHSFFEMLGNFSFGDYFKKEAIEWAWEFLTRELRLSSERLRISVHEQDKEAYEIWRDPIGVPEEWISRFGDETNFWPSNARQKGPNGPCGPCSEIFYDQGEDYSKDRHACSVGHECGRFTEIWNLVFTQYDRQDGGKLVPLRQKNIDTGMGLERLACVVQKRKGNFEIDIFEPVVAQIEKILQVKRSAAALPRIYAIADHIRAVAFAISDGVIPGNDGRGYVIRKLIRRSIWHAHRLAPRKRVEKPALYQLIPSVVERMKTFYPDLLEVQRNIEDTLKGEEERFLRTLDTGLTLLEEKLNAVKQKGKKKLPGEEVFLLYDTYGFPDELTRVIAKGGGIEIDQEGFNQLMGEQRKRAKGVSPLGESIFVTSDFERRLHELPPTKFLGYETHHAKARVLLVEVKGVQGIVVLDQTPFYAESGGQVGDQGILKGPNFEAQVEDTQKKDNYHLHGIRVLKGRSQAGMEIEGQIDSGRRNATMRNHTATHLLHAVLREVLGKQVRQLGSLVHPDRLRFDYSFSRPLTAKELDTIESRVNEEILRDAPVQKEVKEFEEAKKEGALAFFGEKYGSRVRVITVPGISQEFCGGTHCERTGQIGSFIIVSDASIASGVRRIEAFTGKGALGYVRQLRSQFQAVAERLKVSPSDLVERIAKLQERMKELEKTSRVRFRTAVDSKSLLGKKESVGPYFLLVEKIEESGREDLRMISDELRSQAKRTLWILFTTKEEKIHFLIGLSADLKEDPADACELARQIAPLIGGSGGGRKDLAEGGGINRASLQQDWSHLVQTAKRYLERKG